MHATVLVTDAHQQQSAFYEHRVDFNEHRLWQFVRFEQVAKSHQRRGIGHALLAQVDVHKGEHYEFVT
jgi:hypothetical protein